MAQVDRLLSCQMHGASHATWAEHAWWQGRSAALQMSGASEMVERMHGNLEPLLCTLGTLALGKVATRGCLGVMVQILPDTGCACSWVRQGRLTSASSAYQRTAEMAAVDRKSERLSASTSADRLVELSIKASVSSRQPELHVATDSTQQAAESKEQGMVLSMHWVDQGSCITSDGCPPQWYKLGAESLAAEQRKRVQESTDQESLDYVLDEDVVNADMVRHLISRCESAAVQARPQRPQHLIVMQHVLCTMTRACMASRRPRCSSRPAAEGTSPGRHACGQPQLHANANQVLDCCASSTSAALRLHRHAAPDQHDDSGALCRRSPPCTLCLGRTGGRPSWGTCPSALTACCWRPVPRMRPSYGWASLAP